MKVLILGISGMLGSTLFRYFSSYTHHEVFGSVRNEKYIKYFPDKFGKYILSGCDANNISSLINLLTDIKPDIVINCIGIVKQVSDSSDNTKMISINSLLPHCLSKYTADLGANLIHISTDCIFSGEKGNYLEDDISDACDIYGKSKYLGEVYDKHCITLRTSIIGHELETSHGLVEWFLSQKDSCKGYRKAIFSGLPTFILAELIAQIIIPRPELHGVYHIASSPISKFDLLNIIADVYEKDIKIIPDDEVVIDRSLCANKFKEKTGYIAPDWPELINIMHKNQ